MAVLLDMIRRTNRAPIVNPSDPAQEHITTHGSNWLWAVFAVFLLTDLCLTVWTMAWLPRGRRLFHWLSVIILSISTIAYFSMASNLGWTPIATEFDHQQGQGILRQIWYVRYIDWILTAPLLVTMLALGSALSYSEMVVGGFFASGMYALLLMGALVRSSYKWGYFAFALAFFSFTAFFLLGTVRKAAKHVGRDFHRTSMGGGGWLSFFWMLWLLCWGISNGGNLISSDSEMVWFGILDLFLKPIFFIYHLFAIRRLDQSLVKRGAYGADMGTGTGMGMGGRGGVTETGQALPYGAGDVEKHPRTSGGSFAKVFHRRGHHDAVSTTTAGSGKGMGTGPMGTGTGMMGTGAMGATDMREPRMSENTVADSHDHSLLHSQQPGHVHDNALLQPQQPGHVHDNSLLHPHGQGVGATDATRMEGTRPGAF